MQPVITIYMYDGVNLVVFYFRGTENTFHIIQYKCCAVFCIISVRVLFLIFPRGVKLLSSSCAVCFLNWHFKKRNGE